MKRASIPEAVSIRARLVFPRVSPIGRRRHQRKRSLCDTRVIAARLSEQRTVVPLTQSVQRKVVGPEVIDPCRQVRQVTSHDVEVDMIESPRIRIGTKIDITPGAALSLNDSRCEKQHARKRCQIRNTRAATQVTQGGRDGFEGRRRRREQNVWIARQGYGLDIAIDLEGLGLIAPVEKVRVVANLRFAVLGGFVIAKRHIGLRVCSRVVHRRSVFAAASAGIPHRFAQLLGKRGEHDIEADACSLPVACAW